jgi:hypothetical protein
MAGPLGSRCDSVRQKSHMATLIGLIGSILPTVGGVLSSTYSRFWARDRSYLEYEAKLSPSHERHTTNVILRARGTRNICDTQAHILSGETKIIACAITNGDRPGMKSRSFTATVDETDPERAIVQIPLLYPDESLTISLECESLMQECWVETPSNTQLAKPLESKSIERVGTVLTLCALALWGVGAYLIFQGATLKFVGWGLVVIGIAVVILAPKTDEASTAQLRYEYQRRLDERRIQRRMRRFHDR